MTDVGEGLDRKLRPDSSLEDVEISERTPLEGWYALDWRFLLPEWPTRTVAHSERVRPEVVAALSLLPVAAVHEVADAGWSDVAPGSLQLVLLGDPTPAELREVVPLLEPGGSVYAEITRGVGRRGFRSLVHARRALRASGVRSLDTYWHAPDFERCARIVPLGSAPAVQSTLRRHAGIRFGYPKSLIGRLAHYAGFFPLAVSHGSIVATTPGPGRDGRS